MIDIHSHLNFDQFGADLSPVLERMHAALVEEALVVGTDLASSQKAVQLAHRYRELYATVGLHPGDATDSVILDQYDLLCQQDKVVAIGEIGLDYHYLEASGTAAAKSAQFKVLEQFVALANRHGLPTIFHSRDCGLDLVDYIAKDPVSSHGVFHCFNDSYEQAVKILDLGYSLSFTAMITYPGNGPLREVLAKLPHDRVLIETDCPFLPPQARRGERNEPANLPIIADKVGQIWQKPVEYVDQVTSENAKALFKLK